MVLNIQTHSTYLRIRCRLLFKRISRSHKHSENCFVNLCAHTTGLSFVRKKICSFADIQNLFIKNYEWHGQLLGLWQNSNADRHENVFTKAISQKFLSALINFKILNILHLIWVSPISIYLISRNMNSPKISPSFSNFFFFYHVFLKYCKYLIWKMIGKIKIKIIYALFTRITKNWQFTTCHWKNGSLGTFP